MRRSKLDKANSAARELGSLGGKARAAAMTPQERRAAARHAARCRWSQRLERLWQQAKAAEKEKDE